MICSALVIVCCHSGLQGPLFMVDIDTFGAEGVAGLVDTESAGAWSTLIDGVAGLCVSVTIL